MTIEEMIKQYVKDKKLKQPDEEKFMAEHTDNRNDPKEGDEYPENLDHDKKRQRFQRILKRLKGSDHLAELHAKSNFNNKTKPSE